MIEGLWSVEFKSDAGNFGAGVVVFETGRLFGGDSQYYYLGKYEVEGDHVKVGIAVTHYAGDPYSIFGTEQAFKLKLVGKLQVPVIVAVGHRVDDASLGITAILTKRADLP